MMEKMLKIVVVLLMFISCAKNDFEKNIGKKLFAK